MKTKKIFFDISFWVLFGICISGIIACGEKIPGGAKDLRAKEYIVNTEKEPLYFFINPTIKAGQIIDIFSKTKNTLEWEVKEAKLYEDGKLVNPELNTGRYDSQVVTTIKHTSPGIHTYYVIYTYQNGKKQQTETKTIEFAGYPIDNHPQSKNITVLGKYLLLEARDYGDNKGIISAEIYENGKLWKTLRNSKNISSGDYSENVLLDIEKTDMYKYFAWFIDKGGNKTKSATIIVHYK